MLMPIVFAAMIDGVRRARRDSWRLLRGYARCAPALALLVGLFLCTRYPFRDLVNPVTFQPSPRAQAAERVLSAIPDGVTIETDLGLMRMLTHRTRVFYVGNAAPVLPEYLLVDDKGWHPPLPDVAKYAESLHPGRAYVLVTEDDGYRLARRIS